MSSAASIWILDESVQEYYYLEWNSNRWARVYRNGHRAWHDDSSSFTDPRESQMTLENIVTLGDAYPQFGGNAEYTYAAQPAVEPRDGEPRDAGYRLDASDNRQIVHGNDGYVQVTVQTAPPEETTDPELLSMGVAARMKLKATSYQEGDREVLHPNYKIMPRNWFKKGRVLRVLWSEPAGLAHAGQTRATIVTTRFQEPVATKIRWFVIVRLGGDSCTCLPIQTYGGRGVERKVKRHHAIVYDTPVAPPELPAEVPGRSEEGMSQPIKVEPRSRGDRMDPASRINYNKFYTLEYNVKVFPFGKVDKEFEAWLLYNWDLILREGHPPVQRPAPIDQSYYQQAPP